MLRLTRPIKHILQTRTIAARPPVNFDLTQEQLDVVCKFNQMTFEHLDLLAKHGVFDPLEMEMYLEGTFNLEQIGQEYLDQQRIPMVVPTLALAKIPETRPDYVRSFTPYCPDNPECPNGWCDKRINPSVNNPYKWQDRMLLGAALAVKFPVLLIPFV